MQTPLIFVAFILLVSSCKKDDTSPEPQQSVSAPIPTTFKTFTIQKGAHYCDETGLKQVTITNNISFNVRFDSSAMYKTTDPANQEDINKLWGFSEGNDHHLHSARIGWAYARNALRLYGYVYADSIRYFKEIKTIGFGEIVKCQIKITTEGYEISAGSSSILLPRAPKSTITRGYQLFPYFGGDETAPHRITINIQEL